MRNIFDQYTQPENRLTHALVSAMAEDPGLLRRFVKWVVESNPPKRLKIAEQQLPGEYELSEEEYERAGLPDAWIHDDDEWALLIESKVASSLGVDQLKRHHRTAERRGFTDVTVLAIDVLAPKKKLPDYAKFRTWKELYRWLADQTIKSEWATRIIRYMEIAERKWAVEGYLKEGTLTEFSGVYFDEDNPYSYPEGKRLIKLMTEELRTRSDLGSMANLKAPGRAKIPGRHATHVWDYLRLKGRRFPVREKHTSQPHLSLLITHEQIRAFFNAPNSMKPQYRNPIKNLGVDSFFDLMEEVDSNFNPILRRFPGSSPFANIKQSRFASVSATPTMDGKLDFDLRTAFTTQKSQKIRLQEEWLIALYSMIENKNSNLEWAVGVSFPYEHCSRTKKPEIIDAIVESWLACKPILDVMLRR